MSLSDQWTLAACEEEGKKTIYRIRFAAPAFATRSSFRQLLLVLWEFESVNDELLPMPEDLERMTRLENLLRTALENAHQGFLTVTITGNGLREWQWYVRNPKDTMELVNNTLSSLKPFPVQFGFQEGDPEWAIYGRFLDITGAERGRETESLF